MFINIKSDYSTAEIERILSSKRNVKYMRKYVDYDCLLYTSDAADE